MTPAALARLHAAAFTTPRPWSEAEFASLLDTPGVVLVATPEGFALGRAFAGEAELLTIAVAEGARRQGIGARLLARFLHEVATRGAGTVFLEVSADNAPALALYRRAGFVEAGRRRGYYRTPKGERVDALVLRRGAEGEPPEI